MLGVGFGIGIGCAWGVLGVEEEEEGREEGEGKVIPTLMPVMMFLLFPIFLQPDWQPWFGFCLLIC